MHNSELHATYVGGPTVLLEINGLRILTDPTFDPAGTQYATPLYTLHKLNGPAVGRDAIGHVDLVLLSHDHHYDNLDHTGREVVAHASLVLTTVDGATRLGAPAVGLRPWDSIVIPGRDGHSIRVTATPARHGPATGDRGPVIGFLIEDPSSDAPAVYLSGDTVWYEGIAEVAHRARVGIAFLFLGGARVTAVGPAHLTLLASEGLEVAQAFPEATLVPIHYEGWAHFCEGRADIDAVFEAAGVSERLHWLRPGEPTVLSPTLSLAK